MRAWLGAFSLLALSLGAVAPASAVAWLDAIFDDDADPGLPTPGVYGVDAAIDADVSPDGKHVYVAAAREDAVTLFTRDSVTGLLEWTACYWDPVADAGFKDPGGDEDFCEVLPEGVLTRPLQVLVSPDGKNVYLPADDSEGVAVFLRNATTGALTHVETEEPEGGLPELQMPTAVAISPDGANVYVTGFLSDTVVTFSRNPNSGQLTFVETYSVDDDAGLPADFRGQVNPSSGLRFVTVSPDGKHVYTSHGLGDGILGFARDLVDGSLTRIEFVREDVEGVTGIAAVQELALSPDGAYLYATGCASDAMGLCPGDVTPNTGEGAIALFSRDAVDGSLDFIQAFTDGDVGPDINLLYGIEVSPDGRFLYTTSPSGSEPNALSLFARDAQTGAVMFIDAFRHHFSTPEDGMIRPRGFGISPDGEHIYVASQNSKALVTFIPEPGAAGAAALLAVAALAGLRRRASRRATSHHRA